MKLIFLDIDGVLNNTQNIKKYRLFFRGKRRLLVDVKPVFYLKKLLNDEHWVGKITVFEFENEYK